MRDADEMKGDAGLPKKGNVFFVLAFAIIEINPPFNLLSPWPSTSAARASGA
jgi:hypothetical protein